MYIICISRVARIVVPDMPHHITQRGNYKQCVFDNDCDRKKYLSWVEKYSKQNNLEILSFCLMTNHIHFIAVPSKLDSLARTFSNSHMVYSHYYNKKIGLGGHLWKGRFFSCVMDEFHLVAAARYIERNPVRAGLVKYPWDWDWSSAAFHCGKINQAHIELGDLFRMIDMNEDEWITYISREDDPLFVKDIKKSTSTGRPLARAGIIKKLEKKLGKILRANPPGRPWK